MDDLDDLDEALFSGNSEEIIGLKQDLFVLASESMNNISDRSNGRGSTSSSEGNYIRRMSLVDTAVMHLMGGKFKDSQELIEIDARVDCIVEYASYEAAAEAMIYIDGLG